MKTENLTPQDVHSYPSGYELAYPECEHIRSRVVFDGGNRFLKWVDTSGVVQCIPSCIKECSEYQWKRLKPDPQTAPGFFGERAVLEPHSINILSKSVGWNSGHSGGIGSAKSEIFYSTMSYIGIVIENFSAPIFYLTGKIH